MIVLDTRGATPLYVRIYDQIKNDILNGEIVQGTKLPSGRALASELCVSRNTVDLAYSRLADDGFIIGVPRVGYFAESRDVFSAPADEGGAGTDRSKGGKDAADAAGADEKNIKFDFRDDRLHPDELPRVRWQKLMLRSFWEDEIGRLSRRERFNDDAELRDEIRKHVYRFRNIECDAVQIFPATDALACLELACLLLKSRNIGSRIGMEDPCSDRCRRIFSQNGFEMCPILSDAGGASLESAGRSNAGAVYLSPSCHFPTGAVMTRSRRDAFADWARRGSRYIIEDDCGCHFYYYQRPVPAIHSLCPEKVVYIAGLSDILFPGSSVSWMILPMDLALELRARLDDREPLVPFLMRRPLELYMREGYLESRIRRVRRRQGLKREALIGALAETFGDRISVSDTKAGAHIMVRIKSTEGEDELVKRAGRAGVALCTTARYRHGGADADDGSGEAYGGADADDGSGETYGGADAGRSHGESYDVALLLHCGGIRLEDIPRAVRLLGEAWA
jgi:GntR family transcriptional regulator/MocR family aminotransferase